VRHKKSYIITRMRDAKSACRKCGKKFKIGDVVFANFARKTHKYHLSCWERLFIE
jgi:hypothetical protein